MNDTMGELVQTVLALLRTGLAPLHAAVAEEYPNTRRANPPTAAVVAVGVREAQLLPCALGDYLGEGSGGGVFGKTLEITLSMQACVPPVQTAAGCRRLFGALCNTLLFTAQGLDIRRVWCTETSFEKELGMLVLPCFATLCLQLSEQTTEQGIEQFVVRSVM